MKIEELLSETLKRAATNEPPVIDAWARFERVANRRRVVRLVAAGLAAAAAVAVALVLVPELGKRDEGFVGPGPTESPDPTNSWRIAISDGDGYQLRYPLDWIRGEFEGTAEFRPPGTTSLAQGHEATSFAVTVRLDPEPYDAALKKGGLQCPGGAGCAPGQVLNRPGFMNGRAFLETHLGNQVQSERYFRIDWPAGPAPSCPGEPCPVPGPRALEVRVLGSSQLWDRHRDTGELIVRTIRPFALSVAALPDPSSSLRERLLAEGFTPLASPEERARVLGEAVPPGRAVEEAWNGFGLGATDFQVFVGKVFGPKGLGLDGRIVYAVYLTDVPTLIGGPYRPTPEPRGPVLVDHVVFVDALTGKALFSSSV